MASREDLKFIGEVVQAVAVVIGIGFAIWELQTSSWSIARDQRSATLDLVYDFNSQEVSLAHALAEEYLRPHRLQEFQSLQNQQEVFDFGIQMMEDVGPWVMSFANAHTCVNIELCDPDLVYSAFCDHAERISEFDELVRSRYTVTLDDELFGVRALTHGSRSVLQDFLRQCQSAT